MLDKIKKQFIKNETILVFILIIFAVSAFAFNIGLGSNDELWNFSNIYKMTNGKTIYKELNVIITPLFFYIGKIIFEFLGSNYLVFRIYNVIICTIFYMLIYTIYKTLGIKGKRNILYLILAYILTFRRIASGANYNILAIDMILIGILCILKGKKDWIQGAIIFLIFMTKQNVGIYYAIGYIVYKFIENKDFIKTIKKLIPVGMITILLIGIYLTYLFANENLYNFIDYVFLGIGEFGNKNFGFDNSIYTLGIALLVHPIMIWIFLSKKINIDSKIKKQGITLISFALPSLMIAYPLINESHVNLAIILTIITFIFIMEKSFLEELTESRNAGKIINIINAISIIVIISFSLYVNIPYFVTLRKYDSYNSYYGSNVDADMKNNINTMVNYITQTEKQGYNVKILSYKSNLYMNILNKNNKNMDLPFYGNLGKEGEDGLIEEIKELKNTNLLISKEEDKIYQESKKVREYVLNNYERIGEIEDFFIYKIGY